MDFGNGYKDVGQVSLDFDCWPNSKSCFCPRCLLFISSSAAVVDSIFNFSPLLSNKTSPSSVLYYLIARPFSTACIRLSVNFTRDV